MQACIEECEGVGEDLLDILLLPLLPHSKLDNPAAYQVAGTVLRRVANSIKSPITALINRILVGASHEYAVQGSDLREHVYSLIYELHRVSADLLHGVLPNVCLQLQVEELDVRLRAVKVLSSLFASTYADYAKEFARNFKEYLGRLNDISVDIRLEVVESCAVIVQNKPSLLSLIEGQLSKLSDPCHTVAPSCHTVAPSTLPIRTYPSHTLSSVCRAVGEAATGCRRAGPPGSSDQAHRSVLLRTERVLHAHLPGDGRACEGSEDGGEAARYDRTGQDLQ